MSLVYHATAWTTNLWQSHVRHSRGARQVLTEGKAKQKTFPDFAQSVHDCLYLRHKPDRKDTVPAWATRLFDQAHDLAEWKMLRARCARNGFAAGVCAETLLEALLPLLPDEPEPVPRQTRQDGVGATQGQGQEGEAGQGPQLNGEAASAVRRALRQAMREAQSAVEVAEASTAAVGEALGLHAGTGPSHVETLHDLDQVRQLWALLKDDPAMRHIAEMAGRLQRLGQAHKRCQVTPAVGRIKGITVGGDLDRILPSELAGLRSTNRIQRLATLGKIVGKRALQYEMQGEESETRGPILVLLDESGSMRGESEQWSKAVALALLTTATQQKRAWWLCGFASDITHEHLMLPGHGNSPALLDALAMRASGGTNFELPMTRALQVLREQPALYKADMILVTDGEADITPDLLAAINHHRQTDSLHVYVVGIGGPIKTGHLSPMADAMYTVSAYPEIEGATVAPMIALVA